MKACLLILTSIILYIPCRSQIKYIKAEVAEELQNRIVLVELFDENTEDERLRNQQIKEYFIPRLSVGKEVRFATRNEIGEALDSGKEMYALLTHELGTFELMSVNRYRDFDGKRTTVADPNGIKYNRVIASQKHYDLTLSIPGDETKTSELVTQVCFAHYFLRPEDYVFAALQFSRLYNAAVGKIAPREFYKPKQAMLELEKKTLLLSPDFMDFDPSETKGYSFPTEQVNYADVRAAILSQKNGYAYPLLIWSEQHSAYDWVVVDCESGKIYSQVTHGGVNISEFGKNEPPLKMKKIHLKSFDSVMANTVNNRYLGK